MRERHLQRFQFSTLSSWHCLHAFWYHVEVEVSNAKCKLFLFGRFHLFRHVTVESSRSTNEKRRWKFRQPNEILDDFSPLIFLSKSFFASLVLRRHRTTSSLLLTHRFVRSADEKGVTIGKLQSNERRNKQLFFSLSLSFSIFYRTLSQRKSNRRSTMSADPDLNVDSIIARLLEGSIRAEKRSRVCVHRSF